MIFPSLTVIDFLKGGFDEMGDILVLVARKINFNLVRMCNLVLSWSNF